MEWLILLMACWFAGLLILGMFAESSYDDLGDDPERAAWVDALAEKSRRGRRTKRNRYSVSGWRP